MNFSNNNFLSILKKVLLVLSLSLLLIFGIVLLIGFLLIKSPKFENLYFAVPYLVMILSAMIISFLSKMQGNDGIYIALLSSVSIALISIVFSFILQWKMENIPAVLGRYVGMIVLSVLFTIFLQKKRSKKVRSSGKFRFSK